MQRTSGKDLIHSLESTTTPPMQHTIDTARSYSGLGRSETYQKYMTIVDRFKYASDLHNTVVNNGTEVEIIFALERIGNLIDLCDDYTSTHGIKWPGVVTRRYEMVENIRAQAVELHDDLLIKGQRLLQDEDDRTRYTFKAIVNAWNNEGSKDLNSILQGCNDYFGIAKDMQKTNLGQQRYKHVKEIGAQAQAQAQAEAEAQSATEDKYNEITTLSAKADPTFADLRRLAKLCEEYTKEFGKFRNTVIGKNRFDELSAIWNSAIKTLRYKIAAASATKKIARAHARVADADTMRDFNLGDTALPEGVQEPDWSKNWELLSEVDQRQEFITNDIYTVVQRTSNNEHEQYEQIKDLYEKVVLEETSSLEYNKDGINDTLTWLMKLNSLCTAYLAQHKSSKKPEAMYHTWQVERIQGVISELVMDTATGLVKESPAKDAILSYVKVMRAFKTYTINRSEGNLEALLSACQNYAISHKTADIQTASGQNRVERIQPIYDAAQEDMRKRIEEAQRLKKQQEEQERNRQEAEKAAQKAAQQESHEDIIVPQDNVTKDDVIQEVKEEIQQPLENSTPLINEPPVITAPEPQNEMKKEIREVKPKIEDSFGRSSEENSFDDFEILDEEMIVHEEQPQPEETDNEKTALAHMQEYAESYRRVFYDFEDTYETQDMEQMKAVKKRVLDENLGNMREEIEPWKAQKKKLKKTDSRYKEIEEKCKEFEQLEKNSGANTLATLEKERETRDKARQKDSEKIRKSNALAIKNLQVPERTGMYCYFMKAAIWCARRVLKIMGEKKTIDPTIMCNVGPAIEKLYYYSLNVKEIIADIPGNAKDPTLGKIKTNGDTLAGFAKCLYKCNHLYNIGYAGDEMGNIPYGEIIFSLTGIISSLSKLGVSLEISKVMALIKGESTDGAEALIGGLVVQMETHINKLDKAVESCLKLK